MGWDRDADREGIVSGQPALEPEPPKYEYGTGAATARCRFVHERIISKRAEADALPTNCRQLYYDGTVAGAWLDDSEYILANAERCKKRGDRASSKSRKMSQNISDDTQWLIDRGHVDRSEVVDEIATTYQYVGVVDHLGYVIDHARRVMLDPWAPNPIPWIMCEGANDLGIAASIGREMRCEWAAFGGMASCGMLRKIAEEIDPAAPILYVGDWNAAG